MKNYWKEHENIRILILAAFFIIGMILVITGWKQTGTLPGLGTMILGLVFLLSALMIYNQRYKD